MKQVFCVMLFLCWLVGESYSQKYSTTLGVRVSKDVYGVTLKQRVFKSFSVEGIAAGSDREVTGTLLLEKHFPLIGKGLNAYVGGGGHIGMLEEFGPTLGADVLIGAELKLPFLPFVVSADFKPAYQVIHENQFDVNSAVSIRYIIGKENKKQRERAREKKKRKKERMKRKKERSKEKEKKKKQEEKEKRKAKKGGEVENKKLLEDVHLLQMFKKEEVDDRKGRKNKH